MPSKLMGICPQISSLEELYLQKNFLSFFAPPLPANLFRHVPNDIAQILSNSLIALGSEKYGARPALGEFLWSVAKSSVVPKILECSGERCFIFRTAPFASEEMERSMPDEYMWIGNEGPSYGDLRLVTAAQLLELVVGRHLSMAHPLLVF